MANYMKNDYLKNTRELFITGWLALILLLFVTGFDTVNGQDPGKQVIPPATYDIDSVTIRARIESRNLMEKPYTEPNSILPSISKLNNTDIRKQGATNVVEAMNYVPGALIETRGTTGETVFFCQRTKIPLP